MSLASDPPQGELGTSRQGPPAKGIRHRVAASAFGAELLLLVSALILLGLAASAVRGGQVPSSELTVFRRVNDLPAFLYWPTWTVMQLGNVVAVAVAALAAVAWRRYRLAIGIAVAGTAAYFTADFVKQLINRQRPGRLLADVHLRGSHPSGLGFVSGHAAVAFAIVTVASLWFGRKGRMLLWSAALVVCFARVYVGAHLPLDVVGGAAVGAACGAIARLCVGARPHGHRATEGV